MSNRERIWIRNALLGGLAVSTLVLAFHTHMAWIYFQPGLRELSDLVPRPGPFWAQEWFFHSGRIFAAAFFFLSLPGLGRLVLPRRRTAPPFAAAGMGLILWATIGFLLAAGRLSTAGVLRPVSLGLAILGTALTLHGTDVSSFLRRFEFRALDLLWISFAVFYLLTSLVPDVFYDALVYHLAAPHAWLQAGRMTDMPDVHLWRLPGLMQTLYLWGLAWSDDRLCKLMNVGIGFLAAGCLGRWAGDRWGKNVGFWSATLFLSSPMVGVNLWSCANDVPAGFFAFLALVLWLEAWESGRPDRSLIFLAGIFFGAGAAAKNTALFAGPFFLLDALRRERRTGSRETGLSFLLFGGGFVLPLLPWWIRTALWSGNPFFPQAATWLGGDAPKNIALLKGWRAEAGGEENFLFRSLSLVRESLMGVEAGRFGFVGPALLMFLPLAFFLSPNPANGTLAAYAVIAYAFFVMVTGRLRYFIPHLPPLFALAAASFVGYVRGAAGLADRLLSRTGRALRFLAVAATALNLLWLALAFQRFNQGFPVVWGRQSTEDYLRQEHIGVYGHPSQGAFDWLRSNGAQGRLFVIGEARTYPSPIPARAAASFNVPPYALWAGEPPSTDRLFDRLRAEGFTYLLINVEEMKRITPAPYKTPDALQALGALFDRLAPPVYRDRWCILFRVPGPAAGRDRPSLRGSC